jgi:hypothetical protein
MKGPRSKIAAGFGTATGARGERERQIRLAAEEAAREMKDDDVPLNSPEALTRAIAARGKGRREADRLLVKGRRFEPRKERRDKITKLIDAALIELGGKATNGALLDHVARAEGVDLDADRAIFWHNGHRDKTTTLKTFRNRVTRRKARLQK